MKLALILLVVCSCLLRRASNSHLDLDDGLDEFEESVNDAKQLLTAQELPKNGDLFEGDIVMDDRMRRVVLGVESKRAYLKDRSLWPNGRVPYIFDKSLLPKIKRKIQRGIAEFKKYTCIRFVPREDTDKDYVIFKSEPHKCSSSVGRIGKYISYLSKRNIATVNQKICFKNPVSRTNGMLGDCHHHGPGF